LERAGKYWQTSGAPRREIADACVATSLREAKRRNNPFFLCCGTWIASRSLSSGAHSRDPLARNDGLKTLFFAGRFFIDAPAAQAFAISPSPCYESRMFARRTIISISGPASA
jgi:hypothetical protein